MFHKVIGYESKLPKTHLFHYIIKFRNVCLENSRRSENRII